MFCPVCKSLSYPRKGVKGTRYIYNLVEEKPKEQFHVEKQRWVEREPCESWFNEKYDFFDAKRAWERMKPNKFWSLETEGRIEKEGIWYIECKNRYCEYHGPSDISHELVTVTESKVPREMDAIPNGKIRPFSGKNCPNCDGTDTYLDKEHNLYGADEDQITTIIHCKRCGTNFESI